MFIQVKLSKKDISTRRIELDEAQMLVKLKG